MIRLFALFLVGILFANCEQETPKQIIQKEEKTPHDFMFMQRSYPNGSIKTEAYSEAIQWKKNVAQRASGAAVWEFTGPLNIGGRITDVEISPDDADTYYVGAASGGIFKTTNGGSSWTPIFDEQEMLSIGDMEISKNNSDLIWVGTGEVNAGGGSLAYDGDGIYKSEDAGLTWETKGLPDVGSIGKILIDPSDDETIFVGAMGPLFRNDTNRGVYRSEDGGDTWEQKLFVSDSTGIIDMAIHPTNGDIVYAVSWERIRRPNRRQYGGETSGIWRSIDGGDNWTELTNGLPSNPLAKGRISIDISQSNPDVLVARYATATGSIEGVYKSTNGGDSWTAMNSSQLTNVGFHWWFRGIFIDPTDEDVLYNVDFIVEKSTDGGNTWGPAFPGVHVDQHALAFNPSLAGEVLLGNDGGLYYSSDNGVSSTKDLTLPITQFYRFHVDAQNGNKIYGGTQDNSTMRTTTAGLSDWEIIFGGDGFQPLVDYTDTNVIYALSQRGNLAKSTNDGATFSGALNGIAGSDRNNWDTPIAMDPNDPNILYYGTDKVYKTTNAAGIWSPISPDLSNGLPPGSTLAFGTITSISVSPLDTDIIYAGTDDGNVWVTEDGGSNWDLISSTLPNRWVTKVLADRTDANSVYVTFSGYRYGEDNGNVYKSEDLGANWTNIGTSLPDIPINDVVKDAFDNVYIGTDIGVLVTGDDGANWQVLGENLPSVVVTDMHLHEPDGLLYAATYGRSSYKLDVSSDILNVDNVEFTSEVSIYPNPASEVINITGVDAENTKIRIHDSMGKLISKRDLPERLSVNVEFLSQGIYFVVIEDSGRKTTRKLIKK